MDTDRTIRPESEQSNLDEALKNAKLVFDVGTKGLNFIYEEICKQEEHPKKRTLLISRAVMFMFQKNFRILVQAAERPIKKQDEEVSNAHQG